PAHAPARCGGGRRGLPARRTRSLHRARRGAQIRTRTRCVGAWRDAGFWYAELEDRDGRRRTVQARAL
ncbi:hypothetical protein XarbCFBP8150_21840, partial [Xanthomonas arboricola]